MGIDETLLKEIVRRVLTVARPDKIILFGSAATVSSAASRTSQQVWACDL